MNKKIVIQIVNLGSSKFNFFLDQPISGVDFHPSQDKLTVAGWVAHEVGEDVTVVIGDEKYNVEYQFNIDRPDVLRKLFPSDTTKALLCGFNYSINSPKSNIKIGIKYKGHIDWIYSINCNPKLKVLIGKDDWLFLDNDTNDSVSQYKGLSLITDNNLAKYHVFFNNIKKLSIKYDFKWSFGVAPAKEFMLEEYYPFKKGEFTVLEQISEFSEEYEEINLFFERLKSTSALSYWKGDTHWTDHGGLVAVEHILKCMNINTPEEFNNINYTIKAEGGDLGTKLSPPKNNLLKLHAIHVNAEPYYDNGVVNHGNVKVFLNEHALIDNTCIVFGGSSADYMNKFLSKVFTRLVSVYTAGSIDKAILEKEKPAYIIISMNSRFLTRAPSTDLDLVNVVKSKAHVSSGSVTEDREIKESFYHDMLNT